MGENYPLPPKFVDKNDKAILLENFKSKIFKEFFVSTFNSDKEFKVNLDKSFKKLMLEKEIEIDSYHIESVLSGIEESYKRNQLPSDIKIQLGDIGNAFEAIEEIENQIDGLNYFHEKIQRSFCALEGDVKKLLLHFNITQEQINQYFEDGYNPFSNREWELITFFPNRITTLKKDSIILKLHLLQQKAINEIWTVELSNEINKIVDELKLIAESTGYID